MERFRSYKFDASRLDDVGRTQVPAIITVGQKRAGELLVLPYATYRKVVFETYGGGKRVQASPRLNTTTSEGGMTEPALMHVLVQQVGRDGHISGGQVSIITRQGKDAAYLVPHNDYWKRIVTEKQGGGDV
jgi:hypothetical protein